MNNNEILGRLQEITTSVLGRDDIVLENKTKIKDLALNSFGLVQLVCAIEEEFDIEIPNTSIKSVNSVTSAVRLIKRLLKEKESKQAD